MYRIIRYVIDVLFTATVLQIISFLVLPIDEAIVDGTNDSFNIILQGSPFRFVTSIDVSNNSISSMFDTQSVIYIDWQNFLLDYLIFVAIALCIVIVIKKIVVSKAKGDYHDTKK